MHEIYDNDFDKAFDEAVEAIEKKEHRLIWADNLIACKFKNDISYNAFASLVRRQPTVEAEPTKHGRWIRLNGDSRFMCSVCKGKENVPTCNGEPTIWDYCPNCGTRMDAQIGEDKSHPFAESVMMGMDGGEK